MNDNTLCIVEILNPNVTITTDGKSLKDLMLLEFAGEIVLGDVILAETGELICGNSTTENPDGFIAEILENYLYA